MMPISSQYVFELQFYGVNYGEKQFVIVDGESMADFSKLKDDLCKCTPEPFRVQYIDDEEDIISIDTEEEFIEFAKLAKQRTSKGMLIKLILNCYDLPLEYQPISPQHATETEQSPNTLEKREQKSVGSEGASGSNDMAIGAENSDYTWVNKKDFDEMMEDRRTLNYQVPNKYNETIKKAATPDLHGTKTMTKAATKDLSEFEQFKIKLKAQLKKEILFEMRSEMSASNEITGTKPLHTHTEYEEDSDGNLVLEKRKAKNPRCQKKLEKKEKNPESKIDQRLEKLELKKKKLLEKSLRISMNRKPAVDPVVGLPCILSAIATSDSSTLSKKVIIGKVFTHAWQLVNDGTVTWNNVELRHTWSSPGLEPDELSLKCPPLLPGVESMVMIKFRAPKTVGPFISYWHFFYQVDSQWQQFGHYVSVSGNTKMSDKLATSSLVKAIEANKKLNEIKTVKTVTFIDKERDTSKEVKVVNDETLEMTMKKQLEACLASSEIAAEMAREAANAAFRRAVENQAAANAKPNVSKQAEKDHIVSSVQRLNLEESGSDTDANLDSNEETDPGFVIVNIPGCFTSDKSKLQNIKVTVYPSGDMSGEGMGTNDINTHNKDEKTETLVMEEREDQATLNEPVESFNLLGSSVPDNHAPVPEPFEKEDKPQTQVFSPLDPNVNYPILTHIRPHIYPLLPNHPAHSQPFGPVPMYNGAAIIPPPGHAPMPHFPPPLPKMVPPVMAYQYPMNAHPPANIAIHGFPPTMPPSSQMVYPQMNPPAASETFPMGPPMFQGFRKNYPYPSSSTPDSDGKMTSTPPASSENTPPTITSNLSENQPEAAQPQPEIQLEQENQSEPAQQQTQAHQPQPKAQPQPSKANKKAESAAQILPQGLVDGAINVAASAYSTAWNALNNLRPKEGVAVEFDPVFENNMALLVEMGFNNLERNAMLLKRFNNDVSQVIGVICATGGGEGLNID